MTGESDSLLRAIAAAPAVHPPVATSIAVAVRPERAEDLARANELAGTLGGVGRALGADSLLVMPPDGTDAATAATLCATCALALRDALPAAAIVIVSHHARGALVERAAAMLQRERAEAIRVDDALVAHLDARFALRHDASGYVLAGERRPEPARRDAPLAAKLHPLTLRFDDRELERPFLVQLDQQSRSTLRSAALASLVVGAISLVFDWLVGAERLWMFNYVAYFGLMLGMLAFTRLPETVVVRFRLVAVLVVFYGVMLQSLWLQVMVPATATIRVFALYMISSASVYARWGLRVVHGPLVWPAYVAYALVMCVFYPVPNAGLYVFWLLQSILLGSFVGYRLEISRRTLFVERTIRERLQRDAHDRDVKVLNDELRRQIAQRAAKLSTALARLQTRPVAFQPGEVIEDRYRVIRSIGSGGMGAVYEVERIADSHPLALKVLTRVADPGALARFAREAQVAAEIDHPNIISVLDVDISRAGTLFLVMELVPGAALSSQRARYGDTRWAVATLRQIASALAAMHARGIIHRDLKPANVLVHGDVVKVADFGLAGLVDDAPLAHTVLAADAAASPDLTQTGAIMGTPLYMAPELVRGSGGAEPSADMFSFGVLAYELLSKEMPFALPPVVERLSGRPAATARPLAQARPDVPAQLCAIIDRCLADAAQARPTAQDVVAALEAAGSAVTPG